MEALCRGGKEREQNRRIDTQSGEAVHGESIKKRRPDGCRGKEIALLKRFSDTFVISLKSPKALLQRYRYRRMN